MAGRAEQLPEPAEQPPEPLADQDAEPRLHGPRWASLGNDGERHCASLATCRRRATSGRRRPGRRGPAGGEREPEAFVGRGASTGALITRTARGHRASRLQSASRIWTASLSTRLSRASGARMHGMPTVNVAPQAAALGAVHQGPSVAGGRRLLVLDSPRVAQPAPHATARQPATLGDEESPTLVGQVITRQHRLHQPEIKDIGVNRSLQGLAIVCLLKRSAGRKKR